MNPSLSSNPLTEQAWIQWLDFSGNDATHFDYAWCCELVSTRYPESLDARSLVHFLDAYYRGQRSIIRELTLTPSHD